MRTIDELKLDPEDAGLIEKVRVVQIKGATNAYAKLFIGTGRHAKFLHRVIMGATDRSQIVDHINGDTLDNRRANLRIVSKAENGANRVRHSSRNTSGYRGVYWSKVMRRWHATVSMGPNKINLGYYGDKVMAGAVAATWRALYMPGARK